MFALWTIKPCFDLGQITCFLFCFLKNVFILHRRFKICFLQEDFSLNCHLSTVICVYYKKIFPTVSRFLYRALIFFRNCIYYLKKKPIAATFKSIFNTFFRFRIRSSPNVSLKIHFKSKNIYCKTFTYV